jgi:transposase
VEKKWIVDLTAEERQDLTALSRAGTAPVRKVAHARILLLADEGLPDGEIALRLGRNRSTVERTRKRFVQNGLEDALSDRPRPGGQPKLDDHGRATLIAVACSPAPDGRKAWTLQLLADELVARGVVPAISDESVRRELKKATSSRGSRSSGASRRSAPRT